MKAKRPDPVVVAVTIAWTLLTFAAIAVGEVTFHIQREGTESDDGLAQFAASAGAFAIQDFESSDLGPEGSEVPVVPCGPFGLQLAGDWGGPYVPILVSSSEFDDEGKIYGRTLFPGLSLAVSPTDGFLLSAFGLWLFDDGRAYDAAYRLAVVEADGAVWQAVLVNEIPRDGRGHEIEGFIGVTSSVGISSLTVTPVDPAGGEPIPDVFETDQWMVAGFAPPPDPCPVCGDLDGDADVDRDDYRLFLGAFGSVAGQEAYLLCADADGNGAVDFADFRTWIGCFRAAMQASPNLSDPEVIRWVRPDEPRLRRLHQQLIAWPRRPELNHPAVRRWSPETSPGRRRCRG